MGQETEERGSQPRGFKVEDRRRFTATGEPREGGEEPPAAQGTSPPPPSEEPSFRLSEPPPRPEITFSTFVLSLGTQALVQLGEMPDPLTRKVSPDLVGAQQTIDILGVLEEKTRGNLNADEAELLRRLLFDLRLRYVEKTRN